MNPSICTFTGLQFNFIEPTVEMVSIVDIAHALSNIARFTGHTKRHYSVAQHSVWVSQWCNPGDAGYGLLHDAAEAYVGDMASPLKQLIPEYKAIEERVRRVIYQRFGLDPDIDKPPSVKRADNLALDVERTLLMPEINWWPKPHTPVHGYKLTEFFPQHNKTYCKMFLERFSRLVDHGLLTI